MHQNAWQPSEGVTQNHALRLFPYHIPVTKFHPGAKVRHKACQAAFTFRRNNQKEGPMLERQFLLQKVSCDEMPSHSFLDHVFRVARWWRTAWPAANE